LRFPHLFQNFLPGGSAGKRVGLGQQIAFGRNIGDFADEGWVLPHAFDNLRRCPSFRNGHGMRNGVAFNEVRHDLMHRHTGGKRVFARLQFGRVLVEPDTEIEDPLVEHAVIDDTLAGETVRNA